MTFVRRPVLAQYTTVLSNAQVKLLQTTLTDIAPAPGVGKVISSPLLYGGGGCLLQLCGSVSYDNISANAHFVFSIGDSDLEARYGTGTSVNDFMSWPMSGGEQPLWFLGPSQIISVLDVNTRARIENLPLQMSLSNLLGNLTQGAAGTTLKVSTQYYVVPL